MAGNYEKSIYNQLMEVMARLDTVERETSRRQSDGRIVPMKVDNATRGKAREGCSPQPCHAK